MSAILQKEIRLSSLPLTWLFISFGVMTLIPGYPILCSVFFITLGIYQSFQSAREANDILYSALGMPLAGNEAKIKQRIGYSTGAVSWFPRKTIKKSQWQRMM